MTGDQFASPPCFLHELDPDFVAVEPSKEPKKAVRRPARGDADQDVVKTVPKDR